MQLKQSKYTSPQEVVSGTYRFKVDPIRVSIYSSSVTLSNDPQQNSFSNTDNAFDKIIIFLASKWRAHRIKNPKMNTSIIMNEKLRARARLAWEYPMRLKVLEFVG